MSRFELRVDGRTIPLPVGDFWIGRDQSCNLTIADRMISRRHAVLRVDESRVFVEDASSRNGVMVNGTRIATPRELHDGDRLTVGMKELRFSGRVTHPRPRRAAVTKRWRAVSSPQTVRPDEPTTSISREARELDNVDAFAHAGDLDAMGRSLDALVARLEPAIAAGTTDRALLERLTDSILRLAERETSLARLDTALRLYRLAVVPPSSQALARLRTIAEQSQGLSTEFRPCVQQLNAHQSDLTFEDRVALRRFEGLERLFHPEG